MINCPSTQSATIEACPWHASAALRSALFHSRSEHPWIAACTGVARDDALPNTAAATAARPLQCEIMRVLEEGGRDRAGQHDPKFVKLTFVRKWLVLVPPGEPASRV
jgi:hypothetical protein